MSIIEATSNRLGIKACQLFERVAIAHGYIDYEKRASIWLARYVETRSISIEIVDWCLDVLYPPHRKE